MVQVFSLIDGIVKREQIFPVRKQHPKNGVFIILVCRRCFDCKISFCLVTVSFAFCHKSFPPEIVGQLIYKTVRDCRRKWSYILLSSFVSCFSIVKWVTKSIDTNEVRRLFWVNLSFLEYRWQKCHEDFVKYALNYCNIERI